MLKKLLSGVAALAVSAGVVLGAGYFPGWPIVGQGANTQCVNLVNGSCVQYAPAGPTSTSGVEMIPADTGLLQGINPATVLIPNVLLGPVNSKYNKLIGGDFGTNLWQRTTTPVTAASPTTATMSADRFWVYSASTQVTVARQTLSATTDASMVNIGFYFGARVQRPSAQTGTGAICFGQTLDKQQAGDLLGKNAIFSFYAESGANFSPTNSNVVVHVAYFTAADATSSQSALGAAGTNSKTFALGTTTGYTEAINAVWQNAGTVASSLATIPLTTGWQRYAVSAAIPAVNSSGTAVTALGVEICATPTGTAGTNDWFEVEGLQLQAMPGTVTATLPAGVQSPTGFERRSAETEAALQQYYSYVVNEGTTVVPHAMCNIFTTSNANCFLQFPVPMRLAPAMSYANGFSITATAGGSQIACATMVTNTLPTGNTPAPQGVDLGCTSSAAFGVAGTADPLLDNSGTGVISASAEP